MLGAMVEAHVDPNCDSFMWINGCISEFKSSILSHCYQTFVPVMVSINGHGMLYKAKSADDRRLLANHQTSQQYPQGSSSHFFAFHQLLHSRKTFMIVDGERKRVAVAMRHEDGKNNRRGGPKKNKVMRNYHKGKWSDEEKLLFLVGLRKFGKGKWKHISKILTTRSPIQIKSHGQKLVDKWEEGDDIFKELNEYERMMGSKIQAVGSFETESDDDDFGMQVAPGLVQVTSLYEDDLLGDWMTPSSEPLPTAASLCHIFLPTPKMQVTVRSNVSIVHFRENNTPLLQRCLGTANPISFVSTREEERHHMGAAFSKSPASAFRQGGDDMQAAILLCQLSSATNGSSDALLLLAPRPALSSNCLLPRQSLSSFKPNSISSLEPISISFSSEMEQGDGGLMACYPLMEEQTSNAITPTAFAEV